MAFIGTIRCVCVGGDEWPLVCSKLPSERWQNIIPRTFISRLDSDVYLRNIKLTRIPYTMNTPRMPRSYHVNQNQPAGGHVSDVI